jgi:HSP20 family protein
MAPWFDPFEEIERMHRRLHRLMREVWKPLREEEPLVEVRGFPVDIAETADEIIVRADLPGFDKADIKLKVAERSVDIVAAKREERKEVTETMIRAERRVGTLRRYLTLPIEVDPKSTKATFDRGVLEVRIKKVKPAKRVREIEIE